MGSRGRLAVAICCGTLLGSMAFGSNASAGETAFRGQGRVEIESIQFDLDQEVGEFQRSVLLVIGSGYCGGELPPEFDHFEVVERGKSEARPFKSVEITAYVRFPEPIARRKPCSGLGYDITRRVSLKRPASRLIFYDGSGEPPQKLGRPPGIDSDR